MVYIPGLPKGFLGIGKNSQNCEESVCYEVHFNVIVDMQYLCQINLGASHTSNQYTIRHNDESKMTSPPLADASFPKFRQNLQFYKYIFSSQLNCRMKEGFIKEGTGTLYQIYRFR